MENAEIKCETCEFYTSDMPGYLEPVCFRFPPTLNMGDNDKLQTSFPLITKVWRCGEWRCS